MQIITSSSIILVYIHVQFKVISKDTWQTMFIVKHLYFYLLVKSGHFTYVDILSKVWTVNQLVHELFYCI